MVFNKLDLANRTKTQEYVDYLKSEGTHSLALSAKKHIQIEHLINYVQAELKPKFKTIGNWMMVGGTPNVGKSTIINSLRALEETIKHTRKSGARVGAIPCIT